MFEVKDPKIKLFGKTIELLLETAASSAAESGGAGLVLSNDDVGEDCSNQDPCSLSDSMLEDNNLNGNVEEQESNKRLSGPNQSDSKEEDQVKPSTTVDLKESKSDGGTMKSSKNEEDQNESSERTLKKPDKILPCPRCNSMETKFCYFNNYNVNQPRHFCKNCQRYWTAGGTMRNVPVGAGRRKNKHVASQYHHITVPEALTGARIDLQNGVHCPTLNPNGTVLTFSSGTPLCESMVSVLSIADKSRNGVHQSEELEASTSQNGENNSSSGSSLTSKDGIAKVGPDLMQNSQLFPPQMPCFPRAQWAYPFYPTFGPTSFPVPFYPTGPPYWPGSWNVPWIIPPTTPTGTTSGPNSPTLGKHSRDGNILKLDNGEEEEAEKDSGKEKFLWVPKTLRIDDPNEAAKSSIWATLGIKNERVDSGGSSICKAFESKLKGDGKTHVPETSTVLQANPAALSRSISFHESS